MSAETNNPEVAVEKNDTSASEAQETRKIEQIANRAAKRGAAAEKRYDQEHDIFTK